MRKIVGKVTEIEKNSIRAINNHKNSLEELLLILNQDDDIYKKVSLELDEIKQRYQEWWNSCYNKYHWEKGKKEWTILFETNEIIIDF